MRDPAFKETAGDRRAKQKKSLAMELSPEVDEHRGIEGFRLT